MAIPMPNLENSLRRLLLVNLFMLPAISASAQDAMEVRAVQYALSRSGHYESTVDGQMGPGTRRAMRTYADENGVESDFDSVFLYLARAQLPWEVEWSSDIEAAVQSTLEIGLLDYDSAKFSGIHVAHKGVNEQWISACVDVNAKNRFGAYTGYQWVFLKGLKASVGEKDIYTFFMDDLSDYEASYLCRLGYVVEPDQQN